MSKTIMTGVIKLPFPFHTSKSYYVAIQDSQNSLSSGKGAAQKYLY